MFCILCQSVTCNDAGIVSVYILMRWKENKKKSWKTIDDLFANFSLNIFCIEIKRKIGWRRNEGMEMEMNLHVFQFYVYILIDFQNRKEHEIRKRNG